MEVPNDTQKLQAELAAKEKQLETAKLRIVDLEKVNAEQQDTIEELTGRVKSIRSMMETVGIIIPDSTIESPQNGTNELRDKLFSLLKLEEKKEEEGMVSNWINDTIDAIEGFEEDNSLELNDTKQKIPSIILSFEKNVKAYHVFKDFLNKILDSMLRFETTKELDVFINNLYDKTQ